MQDLAERGLAIVMISSELPEILGMSDRIAVMHGGSDPRGRSIAPRRRQARIMALALAETRTSPRPSTSGTTRQTTRRSRE